MAVSTRYATPGRGVGLDDSDWEGWRVSPPTWDEASLGLEASRPPPAATNATRPIVEASRPPLAATSATGPIVEASRPPLAATNATGPIVEASRPPLAATNATGPIVPPTLPAGIVAPQFSAYSYGRVGPYGSNITAAWRYTAGGGVGVAVIDDGFDPATTARYGNFSTMLSRSFAGGSSGAIGEPLGGFHGTTTSGLIGAAGRSGMPEGVAPAATLIGVKVSFTSGSLASFVQAELYAASVAGVVSNSWGFTGYGVGEPSSSVFAGWYAAMQWSVQYGRGGLGTVMVFAAGNDRANANNLAVQPVTADYRVIAVAAADANGTVASYSTPGAALLVAAIGNNVAVPAPGGSGYLVESGTSYAAPAVSGIVALMLSVNPQLGWRDVQEILAESAYVPAPSAAGFAMNGAHGWNGGGMHFSNDLGFGVVDANVAVNLARAWTLQSTNTNMVVAGATSSATMSVAVNGSASSAVAVSANIRVQHVQVSITDSYLPVAATRLVLIAPDGSRSVLLDRVGLVGGRDLTGGLDVSGDVLTSNAFWGENGAGTWTLQVLDINGRVSGTVRSWSLTIIGDNAAAVASPLVYTPEFAALAGSGAGRTVVSAQGATTIDLIALPATTTINLNGGSGMIDGVSVTVGTGLRNANAEGSLGPVTLTGLNSGGSELTGGEGVSTLNGAGHDTINAGLGVTTINTGRGGSTVRLTTLGTSQATIQSGGGDTIWAGLATATITDTGSSGDTIYAQAANLTFINGSGSSTVYGGTGSLLIQAGAGGGTYYAGLAGNSRLVAGAGMATFYGQADGDVLTAGGAASDVLIAGGGAETLLGGSATGAITLIGGSGNDVMVAGSGRTTFVVGAGADAITVGGLRDLIQIRYGSAGGFDTISGFRVGTDALQLLGFASTATSVAIASQASDGHGGTLLHFADNTRVDLLGITRVTQTTFA